MKMMQLLAALACLVLLACCAPQADHTAGERAPVPTAPPEPTGEIHSLPAGEENAAPEPKLPVDVETALYHQFQDRLEAAQKAFVADFSTDLVTESEPKITLEAVRPAVSVSAEGSVLYRYQQNGVPIRYYWEVYGESGQSYSNYFLLEDFVYVQQLRITHNSMVFGAASRYPLHFALQDYAVAHEGVYLLDHIGQRAVPAAEHTNLRTAQELEAMFLDGSPVE